jgi:hypothetical protein
MSTALVDRPASSVARLVQWAPRSGTSSLIGYATVGFAGGWTVTSIPIYRVEGRLSAGSPSMPELDRDGRARVGADGKRTYVKIIRFEGNAAFERWNAAVLGALYDAGIRP